MVNTWTNDVTTAAFERNSASSPHPIDFSAIDLLMGDRNNVLKSRSAGNAEEFFCSTPKLPDDAKSALDDLGVKPNGVDLTGDHVRLQLNDSTTKQYPNAPKLWFDKEVNFDIKRDGDKIVLSNITGLQVDASKYLPWLKITDVSLEKKGDGYVANVTAAKGVWWTTEIQIPKEVYDRVSDVLKANGK